MSVLQLSDQDSAAARDRVMTAAMRISPSSCDLGPARRLVTLAAAAVQVDPCDAATVATELVTNAVRHTLSKSLGADLALTATSLGGLRICVLDAGGPETGPHLGGAADLAAESGRGLMVVDGLATEWDVLGDERGRIVWARLSPARVS